jgi:hypothetical protein
MVVNCEQVWREVSNYIEGDVDPTLRGAMDEHFSGCKRCASVLAGVRNVVEVYGDERMLEVPAGFSGRLEKKLAQNARAEKSARRWPIWATWLVPVAAVALVVVGLRFVHPFTPNVPTQAELTQLEHNIPPDLVVVAATDTKIFHLSACDLIRNVSKDKLKTMTAKEAMKEGYVPCTRCLRKYLDVTARKRLGLDSGVDADDDEDEAKLQTLSRILQPSR